MHLRYGVMDSSIGGAIKAFLPQGRLAEVIFSVLTLSFPRGTAKALIGICLLVS